ncbi:MAG: alpha/beta fold hydrolase [Rubrivivax sp.]
MPTAVVNGVRLNYVQMDDGQSHDREDLVMVHGLATSLAFWYFQYATQLAKRFRVTLFDLRGHGRSEMPASGYAPGLLASDLGGLLDHLGIEKAHFLAHSFGGVVTLNFACQQPQRVRSLVLADSHISAVRHVETLREWAYGQSIQPILDRHGLELDASDPYFGYKLLTRVAQWQMRGLTVPGELAEVVSPLMGKTGPRTAAQWLRLMDSTTAEAEMMGDDGLALDRLRALQFPILAMYGDHSQARLTGSELLQVWPHAEFRRVRDAGHFFPASRPEEVLSGCERFWGGEFNEQARRFRVGEAGRNHFRSDRVFMAAGSWYFTTREENRVGPFAACEEATAGLANFIQSVQA